MTENVVKCTAKDRRKQIDKSKLNGIDYIDIVTIDSHSDRPYIIAYFFKALNTSNIKLNTSNVRIEGGVKIKNIRAEWAIPYIDLPDIYAPKTKNNSFVIKESFNGYIDSNSTDKALIIYPSYDGDFSTYSLRIVKSLNSTSPPEGFDSLLSSIDFSFKINTHSKFDCKSASSGFSQEVLQEPLIDYLSKDYASFRHLVLSRLALLMPNWKERNVADVGIMMAELLAYVGDYLSYYQDAVATEAYFGTSRSRISVKRHARLLDYYMHSGCNARVWLCIQAGSNLAALDGCAIPEKTKFLTGMGNGDLFVAEDDLEKELSQGAKVFEAMHDLKQLYKNHNVIDFYTWGNFDYCLPKGATQATLYDGKKCVSDVAGKESRLLNLKSGDVLIFEETHSPDGVAEDRDVSHRHAVRLTRVNQTCDLLTNPVTYVVNIEWALEDELPFPLCLSKNSLPFAVAHGNVLLADYGVSLKAEKLVDPDIRLNFHPRLKRGPLTFKGPFDASASAASVFNYDLQDVKADIYLRQLRAPPKNEFEEFKESDWLPGTWMPQQDLFSSNKFKTDFVVETENDGTAVLRFGDGVYGLNPQMAIGEAPDLFYGFYRVGNGTEGNVGADSIKRIINSNGFEGIVIGIRNPLPARGGVNPESMAMVRQNATETAKINERAITDVDYANILKQKCSEVQSATAKTRWTGSWYTVYVMVDRFGRKSVDEAFKNKIKSILNRYRLSGYDLEVRGPNYVPLEIEVTINVSSSVLREEVEKVLLEVFSNHTLSTGVKGFFHPDNFTFGQPIFLRDLFTVISKVDGIVSFSVTTFKRADKDDYTSLSEGIIEVSPYEIIQLDNDANYPENGRITFVMRGGR